MVNIILDGSNNYSGNRLINVSIHIPKIAAFYWTSIDTGQHKHTAKEMIKIVEPLILETVDNNTSKINAFVTDTCSAMRKFHRELALKPQFSGALFTLCDSHGFQLLIKDILKVSPHKNVTTSAQTLVAFFNKSKLQLAHLRSH